MKLIGLVDTLNQLKQQLNSQGLTVDRFDVMVGLEDERFGERNSWAGWNRQRSYSGKNSANISAEAQEKIAEKKSIINDSQVDVHV